MTDMSSSVHFSIRYDGPALANHQMDVRDLAPALIALSDLLEESNRAAFPDANRVRVDVHGNFKSGSFAVDLIAVQTVAQQLVGLLSGPTATAAANLFAILGGIGLLGGGGLIGVIKFLKGRKPSAIRFEGDRTVFELHLTDTIETFEVDLVAGRLYKSRIVRQSLAKVVRPVETEGIDTFACGRDGKTETTVTKDEARYFDAAASEPDVVSDAVTLRVLVQIESAVFKDGNKWRFSDGATSFYAEIVDPQFIARIDTGAERFGKGDVLIVDLRRVQTIADTGLKTEHTIEKVHEHQQPLQLGLISPK